MSYSTLLINQWTGFVRSFRSARTRAVSSGQALLALYIALALFSAGFFFDAIFVLNRPAGHQLNRHLFEMGILLFGLRFFFQRPPRLRLSRYLHLPIRRNRLVRYFQFASLASVYNLFPFFFLVPFSLRHLAGSQPTAGLLMWMTGATLLILITHYANIILRLVFDRSAAGFIFFFLGTAGLQALDRLMGWNAISHTSAYVFDSLLQGQLMSFSLLATVFAALVLTSSLVLHRTLRADEKSDTQHLPLQLPFGRGRLYDLLLLEGKMIARNKRAKQYFIVSIVVSIAYTPLLLSDLNVFVGARWMWTLIGLFASGAFALNYGQLMFAWESTFFDALLTRSIPLRRMVRAKYTLLLLSCIALFLVSLPIFWWMAPDLLPLHVAFLFYNAGITSPLMLVLAVTNQKRVGLSAGGFFQYEGFSVLHWLWMLPTVAPPAALLMLPMSTGTAFSLIAAIGLMGMLLAGVWSQLLGYWLKRRKHRMAAGFRTRD